MDQARTRTDQVLYHFRVNMLNKSNPHKQLKQSLPREEWLNWQGSNSCIWGIRILTMNNIFLTD